MALPINSMYSLTWGDYGTSLVSAIQLLRCHGDLVDCTLAAGGRTFPAHKIVLCAASPLLFELIKSTPCKHPVVMLTGVNPTDLEALLDFVYRGEVSVDQSQLPSLLQAAHFLSIQGLAPETVADNDLTQQMVPKYQDQGPLFTTIAPQQTVQAQVVENFNTVQAIPQQIHQVKAQDNVKDIINQLLPTKKRKPHDKQVIGIIKPPIIATKIQRTDGMKTVITARTANERVQIQHQPKQQQKVQQHQQYPETVQVHHIQAQSRHQQPQQQGQQHQQQRAQQQQSKMQQIVTATIPSTGTNIKSEAPSETIVIVTVPRAQTNTATVTSNSKTEAKTTNRKGPGSKCQSEQPTTCPICHVLVSQTRNLRRHIKFKHSPKPAKIFKKNLLK